MKSILNSRSLLKLYRIILILVVLSSTACQKSDESKGELIRAEKSEVKTYEIVNIISTKSLSEKYQAEFGTVKIELMKTSDSTLTFFVPEVPDGSYVLNFELAKLDFKVTQSVAIDPDQFILDFSSLFDDNVSDLNPTSPEEIAEVDSLKAYKKDVVSMFNNLSLENKRITTLFYSANRAVFQTFSDNVDNRLDASTVFKVQSDCPRTDFKTFYSCTAENLGTSATELLNCSAKFVKMLVMAGGMAYTASQVSVLGPVAWGITAVGISLPLGAAGYLLITEVRPACIKFRKSLAPFLYANWVFTETLFSTIATEFVSGFKMDLKLDAKFRAILDIDVNISSGTKYFINAFNNLIGVWEKLSSILGNSPFYRANQESVNLDAKDIVITDISNPNVTLVSQEGEMATFKSLTDKTETFSYKMKVKKEGFEFERNLTGKVFGEMAEVRIGPQVWTLLNLKVSRYRNGDIIPEVKDSATWANLKTGAWCYHSNSSANGAVYGKLYNWYAVNDPRGLAPEGWHIPDNIEIGALRDYLGSNDEAGGKMKSTSDAYWIPPNDASNSSGFSAMGAGIRSDKGVFNTLGFKFQFWLSNEYSDSTAQSIMLRNYEAKIHIGGGWNKKNGYSVRCIKD